MRFFAFLMMLLGGFVYLACHFSFWAAFAALYMLGMAVVALIAGFGKQRSSSQWKWAESERTDVPN